MKIALNFVLLGLVWLLVPNPVFACSMYKITHGNKTMVGCNEDAWRTTPNLWFRNARNQQEFGLAFSGSRQLSVGNFAPQSGMNEVGLVYSRLASFHPKKQARFSTRLKITNEEAFLTDVLHKCGTIAEVKRYWELYDRSQFLNDIFIYVDSSGKYLVVEPYLLSEGEEPHYVLSNFCPSITTNETARSLARFRMGEDFISKHPLDTSWAFCKALSDTMHVCRARNGDGTLLTSIWDTENKKFKLYFYHNYDSGLSFDLAEELAKGNHTVEIESVFPNNAEFQRLKKYKTPFNTPFIRVVLVLLGGILSCLSLLYGIRFLLMQSSRKINKPLLGFLTLNIFLTGYFFVLATNINAFYLDAPYQHFTSGFISLMSYTPVVLLLFIFPIIAFFIRLKKRLESPLWLKITLFFNGGLYLFALFGFAYWGLISL